MNKTIHQLNEISQIQNEDEFVVFDTAEGNSKKYKFEAMRFPVGMIIQYYGTTSPSSHWLICDGRDTTGTDEELAIVYPVLYSLLGNSNVLPDLQECVLVGIGHNRTNIFDSSETNPATQQVGTQVHDEYNLGEFKDDQFQGHWHQFATNANSAGNDGICKAYGGGNGLHSSTSYPNGILNPQSMANMGNVRYGAITHGRQVGINFLIRAD